MRTQEKREMEKRVEMYRRLLIWNIVFLLGLLCWGSVFGQYNKYQIKWQRTIGGRGFDEAQSIHVTKSGKVLVGGITNSPISGEKTTASDTSKADVWIIMLDTEGNTLWEKTFVVNGYEEYLRSIIETKDGFYIAIEAQADINGTAVGYRSKGFGYTDYWLVKIDSNGNKKWDKMYGSSGSDYLASIFPTKDNGFILGGYSNGQSSGLKSQNSFDTALIYRGDYWVIKVDSNGNKEWDRSFGGKLQENLSSVFQINDSYYLLGGSCSDSGGGKLSAKIKPNTTSTIYWEPWMVKLDLQGNKIFDKTLTYGFSTFSDKLKFTVTHESEILAFYDEATNIIKLDTLGNQVWKKTSWFGKIKDIRCFSNQYFLIGSSPPGGSESMYYDVMDTSGKSLGYKTIDGNLDDFGKSIYLLDSQLFVAGYSFSGVGIDKSQKNRGKSDYWVINLTKPKKSIKGSAFPDFNFNCAYTEPSEYNIPKILVHNKTENTYAVTTDSMYTMYLFDRDTAVLKIVNLDSNLFVACGKDSIVVDMTGKTDTSGVDFPIRSSKTGHCINITSFSSELLRPGRWGDYQLNYQNNAFDTAYNAYIEIEVDTVAIDSIKSPYSFTLTGNVLRFNLGHVRPFGFSSVTYSIKLKTTVIIGSSHCHRAKVFPICNLYPSAVYDSSEIQPMMRCLPNDTVEFTLKNIGLRDQKDWGHSIIYVDELILKRDSFKLTVGNSRVFKYKLDTNKVFTAEVFNSNYHPVTPILIRHNDLCANRRPMIPQNAALNFSRHDEAKEYEEACTIIRGSYDPNMKSVQPVGMFAQHYTATGTELKYRLDFQNTGTDTAFRVVLIDTLSADLDIASFVPGASSHSYRVEFGGRAVKFIFDPIALVDSFKNEPLSHGYVCFKIKHKNGIAPKTKIENFVDIYFDYNAPVRTNTVFNTIFDTILVYVPKAENSIIENEKTSVILFPNPTTDKFYLSMSEPVKNLSIEIYDLQGRLIKSLTSTNSQTLEVSAEGMTKGMYHIRVLRGEKLVVVKKVMVE